MNNYKLYEKYKIENLKKITNTKVNIKLPKQERMLDYINQINNPSCYEYEGRKVILTFKDDCEESIKEGIYIDKYIKQYLKI